MAIIMETYNSEYHPLYMVDDKEHEHIDEYRLHMLCKENKIDDIISLMKMGVNIDILDNKGRTPIYQAFLYDNVELCILLIRHGSNIYTRDVYGVPMINYAKDDKIKLYKDYYIECKKSIYSMFF